MGPRLTLGLVLMAAATLVGGFVSHTAWLIYVSIGCSALAAAGLILSSRRRRGRPALEEEMAWPASLAAPEGEEFAPGPARSVAAPPLQPAVAGSLPPRRRTVGSTLTLPTTTSERIDTDPDPEDAFEPGPEIAPVAAVVAALPRARSPKRNPVVSDWVQASAAKSPSAPRPPVVPAASRAATQSNGTRQAPQAPPEAIAPAAPAPAAPAPAARPAATRQPAPAAAVRRPPAISPRLEEYPFPIEDYDYLRVAEILPLLPELDDQELVEVLLHEQAGANRAEIINRIDALLEGEG